MAEEKKDHKDRVIYLGTVTEDAAKEIIVKIFELDAADPNAPIRMVINSWGGGVDSMFAIYDAMKVCTAPIITIGIGKAMSAATLILAAGKKGERRVSENCRIMMHEIWSVAYGKLYEIKNEVEEIERAQKYFETSLAKETGKSVKTVQRVMNTHKDTYMSATEAMNFGIVDKVIGG